MAQHLVKRVVKKVCRRLGLFDVVESVKVARYQVESSNCLAGKNVLITGGSSGIGLAIAKKSLACGARVLITGRDEIKLNKIKCSDASGRLMVMSWDVTDFQNIESKADEAIQQLGGGLDILVNNAGVSIREKFGSLTLDVWNKLLKTNLIAPTFITQAITNKWLTDKKEGNVLIVSSMAGEEPAFDAYGAAKCALSSMTRGIARTLAPNGIRVNAIAPGVVIGTNLRDFQRSISPDGNIRSSWIPARRYAVPDEIAEIAVFMMSDKASYMNGAVLVCDGAGALRQ